MNIYITGVSGTGKTSIARALVGRGINAIDIDEISHWENKKTREIVGWEAGLGDEWMDAHSWICDLDKLKQILDSAENSVALGHASNQDDYLPFFDKKFVLNCKPETIIHRLKTRTDNDFGKHPEDMERILNWNKGFTQWMVDKGAQIIDADKPLEQVVEEVVSNFS